MIRGRAGSLRRGRAHWAARLIVLQWSGGTGRASARRGSGVLELLSGVLVHLLLVWSHCLIRAVKVEVLLEVVTSDVGVDVEVFDWARHIDVDWVVLFGYVVGFGLSDVVWSEVAVCGLLIGKKLVVWLTIKLEIRKS
jgi:hypothetical protein